MVGQQALLPQHSDPKLWLVHTKPGAEREAVQCLLQKGVDLALRGTPLQIKAAFTQDHLKARPAWRSRLGSWGACIALCAHLKRLGIDDICLLLVAGAGSCCTGSVAYMPCRGKAWSSDFHSP